jgi:hypothetical protein
MGTRELSNAAAADRRNVNDGRPVRCGLKEVPTFDSKANAVKIDNCLGED